LAGNAKEQMQKPSLIRKFYFCDCLENSKSFFSGGVFQVLFFSLNKFSFISKVSGWFCRVAKIGFKVFWLVSRSTLVLIGFVSWLRFLFVVGFIGFQNQRVFFPQSFW
jgi:hypothetical protein